MKKLLAFEQIRQYLIDDFHVRNEIAKVFKDNALTILKSLERGEDPHFPNADIDTFLLDLLHNDGRIYKQYTALGSYGHYPIDIRGLGGVYFYCAPEFDTTGYFLSIDDASDAIERSWADNLVSNNGQTCQPPFLIGNKATEKLPRKIDDQAPVAGRKIPADLHHFFHGELTDVPGRNESWDYYLRYRGKGRWNLITESTDSSGMEDLPETKEMMSTRQLVQWAIERDYESKQSSQRCEGPLDDDDMEDPKKSLGPYTRRLREIALAVFATYCVKCLDEWLAGTWPTVPTLRVLKVVGVTRRGVWIRINHDVYKVETSRGAAFMYPPDQYGFASVVMEADPSMSTGQKVKLNKSVLNQVAQFEPALKKLRK